MGHPVSTVQLRTLFLVVLIATIGATPAAIGKECPKLIGGACQGHGDCDPPTGGKCTDTLTDCECRVPSSKVHGGFFSKFHLGIGVGSHDNQTHTTQTQTGGATTNGQTGNQPPAPTTSGGGHN